MKKILVSMLAVAAMVACSTEDTLVQAPMSDAIGFDTFVDNSTRANDVDINTIKDFGFNVYASVTNSASESGLILTNEKVTYDGAWSYGNTQYWVAGNTYNFTAFAPAAEAKWKYTPANGTAQNGVISFDNAAAVANQDLVFATAAREVKVAPTAQPEAVAFTFGHMLSRVRFSFANGFQSNGNIKLAVSNVHITDAYANGTLEVAAGAPAAAWAPANKTLDVVFGDAAATIIEGAKQSTEHFYLIPNSESATYTVTFDVTLFQAGVEIDTYSHVVEFTCAMNRGMSYDIKTTLTPENTSDDDSVIYPIEFTVTEVEDWANYTEVATKELTKVATADELVAAIEAGEGVKLTADINLDDITRAAAAGLVVDNDLILDGNGYTVTTTAVRALQFIEGANNVTIKNLTLDAPNSERGFQFQADGHNVVIEDVTATSFNYTVYLTATSTNSNVVVKNCDLTGKNTINVWGKDHKVNVENTKITSIDDSAAEGYAPIYNNADNTTVYVNGGEVVITGNNAEDTIPGVISGSANIVFNGTNGDCYVEGHNFAINYPNGYRYTFTTFAEAYETAKAGETIVLLQDITIESHLNINKNVNLDLNGYTIYVDSAATDGGLGDDAIWVRDTAETVISNGNIEFVSVGEKYATGLFATGSSKLTVENVNIVAGGEAVFAQANASVEILSGSFKSIEYPEFTLNLRDKSTKPTDTATITVKGGKYFNFNPADNTAEGANTNFVATGYTVEQEGDWYVVK